jgi:hypothetical protein
MLHASSQEGRLSDDRLMSAMADWETASSKGALCAAFTDAARPMSVGEARRAVEALLRHPVSQGSIHSSLSTGTRGRSPQFWRLKRGHYELFRQE